MTEPTKVYFGYGSNMWMDQMNRRCPQSVYVGVALLNNWRWIICEPGYANIIPSPGDVVYGLIYKINAKDEKSLDGYEGVPITYEKKMLTVEHLGLGGEKSRALVYVNDTLKEEGVIRTEYIYRMNMAIKDAIAEGMPQEYIDKYLRPFVPEQ